MLVMNITHSKVLMNMHWIFVLILNCLLMLFFSADRLECHIYEKLGLKLNQYHQNYDRDMICVTDIVETIL